MEIKEDKLDELLKLGFEKYSWASGTYYVKKIGWDLEIKVGKSYCDDRCVYFLKDDNYGEPTPIYDYVPQWAMPTIIKMAQMDLLED